MASEQNAGFSAAAAKGAAFGRNDGVVAGSEREVLPLRQAQGQDDTSSGGAVSARLGETDSAGHVEIDATGARYLVQRDARLWLLLLSLIVVLVDRLTKVYVSSHLQMGQAVTVIPHVFRITHVLNFGAAFSMFAESASPDAVRWSLVGFSVIATAIVFALVWRMGRVFSPASMGLALILGGAIGNLYDRIKLHYVVDFLEVHIVHYHWPDFNVADSCISVGAVLILIELLWPKAKQTHADDAAVVE